MPAKHHPPDGDLLKATPPDGDPEPSTALVPTGEGFVSLVERLAGNPNIDTAKLKEIIELQERILRWNAEAAFNTAFAQMQPELPTVLERGRTDKGTYAELEDIVERVRPVLAKYGFALNHQTEWLEGGIVKVIGVLRHREGHRERSEFKSRADETGSKNSIQALGSTVSYGRRYTTKDLLCIVTRREDDDGRTSEKKNGNGNGEPEGFGNWVLDLEVVAEDGIEKLSKAFNDAKPEFRRHLMKVNRTGWETLKKKAAKVTR